MNIPNKVSVLFMQSQSYFGSDSMVHSLIMRELDRDRFDVHVACNRGVGGEKSASLAVLERMPNLRVRPTRFGPSVNAKPTWEIVSETARQGISGVLGLAGLAAYARSNRVRIVHGTEKPRDALYGLLLARAVGAKAITHLHVGVDSWMSPLTRWAMRHDDALIGVSEFVARTAVTSGYSAAKVTWVLNGIDSSRWDPAADGTAVRREFGIDVDIPVVSSISRLFPWKGHSLLLDALAKVKASGTRFKLLVVGEDDPRATPGGSSQLSAIRSQVDRLGLPGEVIFTGFRSDVAGILAATDVYAMPSFEEPCSVAFLEAMAMARPVVALRSGGTPELVEHGETGLLSLPGEVDSLAANLSALLIDRTARRSMGLRARERAESLFTPERLAANVEAVYQRVLAFPPPSQ
ncbi:MAG: glycosyltransferase family 4 protein [Acidimicrobiales bacterium]